ncbi:MAG: hypothetical protein ACRC0X_04810 [Brevinema sp.]
MNELNIKISKSGSGKSSRDCNSVLWCRMLADGGIIDIDKLWLFDKADY